METAKKRIDWIDWLKAIGILLVVLGHSNCNPDLRKYIYSFHMPLFFIVAGMTFRPEKYNGFKDLLKDKSTKLLLPYFVINLFTIIYRYFYCTVLAKSEFNFIEILKGIFIGNNDIAPLVNGPTWFILTFFLGELLFGILYKIYEGDKKHLFSSSFLLLIIGYIESITSKSIIMPWHLNAVPVATALIIIGYLAFKYIKENEEKIKRINILYPVFLLGLGAYIAVWVNGKVSFGGNTYKSFILTFTSLFATMGGLSLILMKIKKCKFLSFIGSSSIIILALHKPIIEVVRYFVPSFKNVSWSSTGIGMIIFASILPFAWIIKKWLPFLVGDISRYSKNGKRIFYSLIVIIILSFIGIHIMDRMDLYKYQIAISNQDYVAHALGGIDSNSYTNSKEALENSYNKGIRIFEVDIRKTSDEKLVCVHGWSKKDYEEKLGIEYNEQNAIMSYNQFMNVKIKDKYTPMDFKDLVNFMKKHEDFYILIDIGNQEYKYTKDVYKNIVEESNNDSSILNRLIVGGHTTDMVKAVKETYDFKIVNLYWAQKNSRTDKKIDTKEEFLKYCKAQGISSLSTSTTTYKEDKDIIQYFKDNGLIVYVFTENDEENAKKLLKKVDLVGTDFIK